MFLPSVLDLKYCIYEIWINILLLVLIANTIQCNCQQNLIITERIQYPQLTSLETLLIVTWIIAHVSSRWKTNTIYIFRYTSFRILGLVVGNHLTIANTTAMNVPGVALMKMLDETFNINLVQSYMYILAAARKIVQ